ncbi:MAG: MgtC/SapB family protein [Proteobacteria bacterium]|nr:MgtC/SapB family protein [Pseudomonadota bacterium]
MPQEYLEILIPLCSAWAAGSLIGLERSYHGRPAGFRTHALVCLSSALLMLATVHQEQWIGGLAADTIATDPTRMAQGIMTGIGFIGAGVIFQEGLTVHGLTTAASIFMTAALGILFGIGYFVPAILATTITLIVLGIFRVLEGHLPTQNILKHSLRFSRDNVLEENAVRDLLREHGFVISQMGYTLEDDGNVFEYRMLIGTVDPKNIGRLADTLRARNDVIEYRLAPMGS